MKTLLLLAATLSLAVGVACDDAKASKANQLDGPKKHAIAVTEQEAALVSGLLDARNRLVLEGAKLNADELQLLTAIKKAHDLPATASVQIDTETGRVEVFESGNPSGQRGTCYTVDGYTHCL